MSGVFWGGSRADEVADFDEYDPTPYGGGYDIALTFGRALPPSDEICYSISTSFTLSSSYDHPQYQQHGGRRHKPDAKESHDTVDHCRRLHTEESHRSTARYGGDDGDGRYVRRPQTHEEKTHGYAAVGYGYGRKGHHDDEEEEKMYRKPKPVYGDDGPKYHVGGDGGDKRPSYGRKKQGDDDNSDDDDERRKSRYKKYDDDDSDNDNKKKPYQKNNHRRHDYDD